MGILPTVAPNAVTTSVNNYLNAGRLVGCNTAGANWGNAAAAGANTTVTITCNFHTLKLTRPDSDGSHLHGDVSSDTEETGETRGAVS